MCDDLGLTAEEIQCSARCGQLDDSRQVRFRVRSGGVRVVGSLITAGWGPGLKPREGFLSGSSRFKFKAKHKAPQNRVLGGMVQGDSSP